MQTQLHMRQSLHMPGSFHAVENTQTRVLQHLPSWPEVKKSAGAFCVVFHYSFSRDRFVETCL
eukprot:3552136-Pyramimonas_sp.AAC.1